MKTAREQTSQAGLMYLKKCQIKTIGGIWKLSVIHIQIWVGSEL